jgi:hypothetical protein
VIGERIAGGYEEWSMGASQVARALQLAKLRPAKLGQTFALSSVKLSTSALLPFIESLHPRHNGYCQAPQTAASSSASLQVALGVFGNLQPLVCCSDPIATGPDLIHQAAE